MVSAMSPVTPKPAAEFSTLAMTKSSDSFSISAGMARRAISRPGLPKMSPTNRMRIALGDRNADGAAAALGDARQDDTQLAVHERGDGLAGVERAVHPDGAREAAEGALGDVKGRVFARVRHRRLLAGNEQHVA